jgi:PAS domain S-box-containing protein
MTTTRSSAHPLRDHKPNGSLEQRLSFLEVFPDRVSVVRDDRTVVYLSSAMRETYGDIVGKKCYETALAAEEVCRNCPVSRDTGQSTFPYTRTARLPDGTLWEMTVTRWEDEETGDVYYFSFEHDITESSSKEQFLGNLSSSMDQMADAVCVLDVHGNVVFVNRAFEELVGVSREDTAHCSTSSTRALPPELDIAKALRESTEEGWSGDVTLTVPDGSSNILHIDARPVKDASSHPLGVVAVLRNVTREKSEKVELEKYKSQLEKKMEARTAELARRVSQLTTINKISRVVTSILDPDELMAEFTKSIAAGFGYQHVVIMAMDKEKGELHFRAGHGAKMQEVSKDLRLKLKEGIIGHAAFFSETLVTGDVDADPRYVTRGIRTTKSELAIPILFRGDIIGVLDIQSDAKDAFTRNEVTLLEMLTDILATAIVNARTFTESKEREHALTVLDRISKQISFRQEPTVILDQVARDAAALLKGEKAMVGLRDEATNKLVWVASYNVDRAILDKLEFSAAKGVTGRALSRLKAEVVNDYTADPDARPRDAEIFNIRSIASAPLIIEGRGIGIVNVYNRLGDGRFTRNDSIFLSSLADHAAIALETSNLMSSLNQRVRSQLALLDIALSMQRQIEIGGTYEYVADKLREVVWYDAITFYRIDHERDMLEPVYSRGSYADQVLSETFPVGEGITGHVAKTGKAELVNHAESDPRASHVSGTPEDPEAIMAIPLRGREGLIGVLTAYREGGRTYTPADFEIAQLFANQAAVAVENSELYMTEEKLLSESRTKVAQMSRVLELTTSVMYMDDLDKLLNNLVSAVVSSFGFRRASVSLLDLNRNVFVNRALVGFPEWVAAGRTVPAERVLLDMRDEFRIGETTYYVKFEDQEYGIEAFDFIAHPELAGLPRSAPDAWHERDILIFALKDRSGRLIGYMLVDEPVDLKTPTTEQIEVLEVLAGIASIGLENSRLYEKQVSAVNEIALLNDLMTHDINNFNQGIMGYIELLLQDRRLDEGQKRYAEKALVQVRNNARVIDNIRKLAKVRSMSEEDFTVWDLEAPIAAAVQAVSRSAPERSVQIVSNIARGAHFVRANPFVNDLFMNVISNAAKFDTSKKVRVDITMGEMKDSRGEFWVVSVTDRGRGIPDDRKRTVFERFATGVTGVKGFGLGLSIVGTIVEKFQGRIWVEDRVKGDFSKGAVFKVMLPKAQPPKEEKGEPTPS